MVRRAVGSFPAIINCLLNRSRNAIYSKHRVKVLKAKKEAFHKLKAFRGMDLKSPISQRQKWLQASEDVIPFFFYF